MSERERPHCRRCGSPNVRWYETKSGRWVLMNTTGNAYFHEYQRGPHAATCPGGTFDEDLAKARASLAEYEAAHPEQFSRRAR